MSRLVTSNPEKAVCNCNPKDQLRKRTYVVTEHSFPKIITTFLKIKYSLSQQGVWVTPVHAFVHTDSMAH